MKLPKKSHTKEKSERTMHRIGLQIAAFFICILPKSFYMDKTKKILNIATGISIVICSISLFIFSIQGNTAHAQIPTPNGFQVVGVLNGGVGVYDVIGFNPKTGETKILGKGHY